MARMRYGIVSIVGHVVVIALCLSYASIRGCRLRKQPVEIKELTIAIDPFEEEPQPVNETKAEPEKTPPPPPKQDDVVIAKEKPKPPEPKKVEPKKVEPKKPDPPKKEPIKKGKRVNKPPVKSDKPVVKPATEEEIKKFLANRNKIKFGEVTSIPDNELSWNLSILNKALYDSWNQPSREAAGTRPATVSFKIDGTGRISDPRITSSSGSDVFDKSVLDAVHRTGYISGLSQDFIRACNKGVEIEFKLR